MDHNFNHFVKQKKQKRRFWWLLLLSLIMAVVVVFIQECNQRFEQPYNTSYQPLDQQQ